MVEIEIGFETLINALVRHSPPITTEQIRKVKNLYNAGATKSQILNELVKMSPPLTHNQVVETMRNF